MGLDQTTLERLIRAAGYGPATGVAVGISSRGARAWAGLGALDVDDAAYAGSLAKQFTGACAALLVREGAIEVEASMRRWLPDLPAWAESIRVRHLVHHTAGLPTTDAVWDRMEQNGETEWTSDGVIAALSTLEPETPPGAVYAYSNGGYICLARIVERASGDSLADFARERLFEPVDMSATTFSPPEAALLEVLGTPAPLSVGDGGLWTTVRDLVRWNDALIRDTLGLSDTIHRPGALDDGTPLDYAWGVRVFDDGGIRLESHGVAGTTRRRKPSACLRSTRASPLWRGTEASSA